ncbi:MAG: TlyA family RNA methyltransferase [Desulfocapsaceae bacterium]
MVRLDTLLRELGHCSTLSDAAALIMAGRVLVDDRVVDKAGSLVAQGSDIRIKQSPPYVSRGGTKLKGGLDFFSIDPKDWICVDIGASTGGFTDCLLQAGASRVYAVDVAYGILDWKLRSDPRVSVLERCNARYIKKDQIPEAVDFCVFDTSFISLTRLLPPVIPLFDTKKVRILCLVKPQFELDRSQIDAGGIVTEKSLRVSAVEKIIEFCSSYELVSRGYTESSIKGTKGNQEYLLYMTGS